MKEGLHMAAEVSRRDFLGRLGVTVGAAATAAAVPLAGGPTLIGRAEGQPKGNIPDTPFKVGHMTFFSGPGAVLGEPSYKGHMLAADEINAQGGLLGKRKIETIKADEAAGTDACVKEMRRMKLSEKVDVFTGVISSGTTPAPHYIFRITNMQSADGVTAAVATAMTWPKTRRIAHIHPDYTYGRNAFAHFNIVMKKMVPGAQVVSEGWPKLFSTDFTSHITKAIAAKPDLLVSSVWGGDYVAMYKQALRYDMFKKMKFTSTIAFGVAPHAIGKDHPEGAIAGVHSNYYFNYPPQDRWTLNSSFVKKYFDRWKEYPNFQAEGAYTTLMLLKQTIEKANKLMGGWPDDEALISLLEGASISGPAGYIHIRPDNHQGYKDAMTGFSMNSPDYPFQILDPNRIITIPIRNITAPPGWPAPTGDDTRTYTWIDKTWPTVKL
ncbi:MAG: hypothetical protein DME10_04295 [Candidatus Rokuibacteriota bacterium]|nr:MAG: hypothetical protein DME10_04295 [Candidatus Rokubacteria bacterium]